MCSIVLRCDDDTGHIIRVETHPEQLYIDLQWLFPLMEHAGPKAERSHRF